MDTEQVQQLAEKWFGPIPAGEKYHRDLPQEAPQLEERRATVTAKVPLNSVYIAFQMAGRMSEAYYVTDLVADILSRGNSSRLYKTLVKEKQVFSEVHAYMTGSLDTGMFVIDGRPLPGISVETAEAAIWDELEKLKAEPVTAEELTKVKNKTESTMVFSEMSLLDNAMNLAYFELLGDAELLNVEVARYLSITAQQVQQQAQAMFVKENSTTLIYLAE